MQKNVEIANESFISSKSFSNLADLIYSETISTEDYIRINSKNTLIVSKTNTNEYKTVTYKKNFFKLYENDIIFSNTEVIDDLFFHLRKIDNLNNLTLITSECDVRIDKYLYNKKPSCIKKWYSANIDFEHEDLISIPLGLAKEFSKKNANFKNFKDFNSEIFTKNNSVSMYVNFQENTNYTHRKNLYSYFKDLNWVTCDDPNQPITSFIERMKNHTFSLCPWGNGIDTHRIFESLYLGTIPVVKYHKTYQYLEELPVVFVNNYKDINKEYLNEWLSKFNINNYNFQKLNQLWWEQNYFNDKKESDIFVEIKETETENTYLSTKRENKNNRHRKLKKLKTYKRKIYKALNI